MPICPRCDVAYLPDEKHVCPRPDGQNGRTLGILLLIVGLAAFACGVSFYTGDRDLSLKMKLLVFALVPAGVVLAFVGTALLAMFRK